MRSSWASARRRANSSQPASARYAREEHPVYDLPEAQAALREVPAGVQEQHDTVQHGRKRAKVVARHARRLRAAVGELALEQDLETLARRPGRDAVGPPVQLDVHSVLRKARVVIAREAVVRGLIAGRHQGRVGTLELRGQHHDVDVAVGAQGRVGVEHARRGGLEDDGVYARPGKRGERGVLDVQQVADKGAAAQVGVGHAGGQALVRAGVRQAARQRGQAGDGLFLQLGVDVARGRARRQRERGAARERVADDLADDFLHGQAGPSGSRTRRAGHVRVAWGVGLRRAPV